MNAEDLVRNARGAVQGSVPAECAASHEETLRVVFEQNEFSQAQSITETICGLRVIQDGRTGFVSTNQPDRLGSLASEARLLSSLAPPSPHARIPEGSAADLVYVEDPGIAAVSPDDAAAALSDFVNTARLDPRVMIDRAEIAFTKVALAVANNRGVCRSVLRTLVQFSIMGMARDGEEVTSFDYDGGTVVRLEDLAAASRAAAERFAASVLSSLHPEPVEPGRGTVLFHPRAVSDLIASLVSFNVNARTHQDRTSSWSEKLGQRVAMPGFDVFENPLDSSRPEEWALFDREGIPCENRAFISDGILRTRAHNAFTSTRGGESLTGNAAGGPAAMPGISLRNMTIQAGQCPQEDDAELLKRAEGKLVIVRFSGNDDPVSGEFSGLARNSWLVKNGKTRSAGETMVAGNVFEMLHSIKAAGRQIHPVFGGASAPYLLIDGLTVTAGGHG